MSMCNQFLGDHEQLPMRLCMVLLQEWRKNIWALFNEYDCVCFKVGYITKDSKASERARNFMPMWTYEYMAFKYNYSRHDPLRIRPCYNLSIQYTTTKSYIGFIYLVSLSSPLAMQV